MQNIPGARKVTSGRPFLLRNEDRGFAMSWRAGGVAQLEGH